MGTFEEAESLKHNENQEAKRPVSKQIFLGLLANFSSIAPSMSLGFSAVVLPTLTNIDNPHFLIQSQASWFASIASLSTPFGSLFSGPISDRFGRRTALFCINTICFLGWITIASAYYLKDYQYAVLLVGRLLTGLSTGLSSMPANIYMAEISSNKLRGVFTTWSSISFSLGVLLVYFLGFLLKEYWGTISLITASLPCLGMLFSVFFIPESPSWLVGKNRLDEARKTLCVLYGTTETNSSIDNELDVLIQAKGTKVKTHQKTVLQQIVKKMKHLLKPNCLKPLAVILTYFFFQQFSGLFVIIFYAINIVQDAGVKLDPYATIVMIGLTRFVAAVFLSYISKKIGRRPLSILSGVCMTICMMILAGYILLIEQGKVTESVQETLQFFPVILLLIYFFGSTLGFLTLPFSMAAEVFPTKIRGTASGLTSCIAYIFSFITIKIYPTMLGGMHRQGVFFFYGIMSLAGTVFVFLLLPETRGKSFKEIEEYFEGSKAKKSKEIEMERLAS